MIGASLKKKYNTRSSTLKINIPSDMTSLRSRTDTFIEQHITPILSPTPTREIEIIDLTNLSSDSDDEDSDVDTNHNLNVSGSDSDEVCITDSNTATKVKIEKRGGRPMSIVSTVKVSNTSMGNIKSTLKHIQMLANSSPESEKLFVALSCVPMISILLYMFYPISTFILTAPWFAILYMWKSQFNAVKMYPTSVKEN